MLQLHFSKSRKSNKFLMQFLLVQYLANAISFYYVTLTLFKEICSIRSSNEMTNATCCGILRLKMHLLIVLINWFFLLYLIVFSSNLFKNYYLYINFFVIYCIVLKVDLMINFVLVCNLI